MDANRYAELVTVIGSLNVEELQLVGRLMAARRGALADVAVLAFRPGMKVEFETGRAGSFRNRLRRVTGTVTKVSRKSVTVAASDGMSWRVAASLLKRVA